MEKYTTCGLFCVYGANTALYCFICVLNPAFSCSDCVQLVFIAATGGSRTGFSDGFILASGAYMQPINADAIVVHNGYCKGFVSNALHRTFAVALVARTSHAGFINEFARTIALAANNNICFHSHSPFFPGGSNAARVVLCFLGLQFVPAVLCKFCHSFWRFFHEHCKKES